MGKFEKENITKKVKLVSQVFAVLASLGILIIGLQFFSKTTGYDIFNINYSLSKLFSDEEESPSIAESSTQRIITPIVKKDLAGMEATETPKNVENFLDNHISIPAIKPSISALGNLNTNEDQSERYLQLNLKSLRLQDFFKLNFNNSYTQKRNQSSLLLQVKDKKISRWSLGLSVSPTICYRKMVYSDNTVSTNNPGFYQSQVDRNNLDKALMKYSLSIDLIYRISKKLSLQSGLIYYNTGESVLIKEIERETTPSQYKTDFFEGHPDFESPNEPSSESNIRFANNLSYWELPLIANYRIKSITDFTELELQLGASISKLGYANAMVYNFDNNGYYLVTGKAPMIYQKFGSNVLMGLVYNKYITNRIQLFANPQMKLGLTNIFNPTYNIKQHNYSGGVRLGMKINL
jgi:hypothetical protein